MRSGSTVAHNYLRNSNVVVFIGLLVVSLILSQGLFQSAQADIDLRYKETLQPFQSFGKAAAVPLTQNRSHRVGNVWMTITNWGIFGSQFRSSQIIEQEGPYAGTPAPSFEFPAGSGINYLFWGALWFGAIVGEDTLVSTGTVDEARVTEFFPTADASANIIERSTRKSSDHYSIDAISEQDYVAEYTDTLTDPSFVPPDPFLRRPHIPLGLQVTQKSYSWGYDYAQDFILLDFVIRNIGDNLIEAPYMGLFIDADCWHEVTVGNGSGDDYSGYLHTVPSAYPGLRDTINIAWTADNDGDPTNGAFDFRSPTGVSGTRVVRGPASAEGCGPAPLDFSFNWWTRSADARFDWGPRKKNTARNFGTGGEGTPSGDLNKYYVMANNEFDFDQLYSAVDFSDSTDWRESKQGALAANIADGTDTRYLFSFGPLSDLAPGDSTYVTLAYVAGENFHVHPNDFEEYFDPQRPWEFYERLDFSDFARNAQWAAWVFDNPGVDSDGDGCRGLYYLVNCRDTVFEERPPDVNNPEGYIDTILISCDTIYYAGDGVPDFNGPPPPQPPEFDISARPHELTLRWSGINTETDQDNFTFKHDFEGYRVYIAEYNALSAFSLVASWDIVDYKRYYFDESQQDWIQTTDPLRLETLLEMYPDFAFDPEDYSSPRTPFIDQHDSAFYFVPQDWNRGNEYAVDGQVIKNQIQYVRTDSVFDDRDQVWRHFGHYEITIENLLPSQPYYVAISAFDYGNREILEPLESSPLINATPAYATYSSDNNTAEKWQKVVVYPNPYKISADYRGRQYEDRERQGWSERDRRIHFVNLPEEATIKIFTLDGDLVREIHHPHPRLSDTSWHLEWDLITRNTQAVTSGIYIWTVESDLGTQIGKFVIIR